MQGTYKNGKSEGPWVSYYDNGQLEKKGTYSGGMKYGPWVSYYGNGQLEEKGAFKNDKREGPWYFYDKDGKKILIGNKKHQGSGRIPFGVTRSKPRGN